MGALASKPFTFLTFTFVDPAEVYFFPDASFEVWEAWAEFLFSWLQVAFQVEQSPELIFAVPCFEKPA